MRLTGNCALSTIQTGIHTIRRRRKKISKK
jgi:hypothetical protein